MSSGHDGNASIQGKRGSLPDSDRQHPARAPRGSAHSPDLSMGFRGGPQQALCSAGTPRTAQLLILTLLALSGSLTGELGAQEERGDPIAAITLTGLSRVAEAEVLARMQIRVGEPFNETALNAEYQRLWGTGDFLFIHTAVVERQADGIHITLRFEEKQRVVEVHLSSMEALGRNSTKEALATQKGALLEPISLRQDQAEILRLYHKAGYLFAAVDHSVERRDKGVAVIFQIQEGSRIRIEKIDFRGARGFSRGELLDEIALREHSWFLGIPHGGKMRRDVLFEAVEALRSFYRRKGYFDAQVAVGPLEFSDSREWVTITFEIEEGAHYLVSRVDFEVQGKRVFTDVELSDLAQISAGDTWDGDVITKDSEALRKLYSDKAYVDARIVVEPIHELTGNEVALRFVISEGEKIFIEEVKIRGNVETRDKVSRRQLAFYPGEEFRSDKIQDSVSNLYRIGYFSSVTPSWEAGSQPGYKNILIDVEEGSTGRMIFGAGVTTGQGISGSFSLQKNNFDITDLPTSFSDIPDAFSGGGQTLVLQAQPGTRFSRYRFQFVEPFVFDSLNSLSVTGFRSASIREDYTEESTAGELTLGRRFLFDRRLSGDIGYRYEVVDVKDVDTDAIPSVLAVEGKTHISSLTAGIGYDRRVFRPIVGPVSGWNTRFGYEYAGGPLGAQLDMSKANISFNYYATIFSDGDSSRHILTIQNDFGWMEGHHDTRSIPLFERFYLGGSSTLRAFRFREVGPKELFKPVGGNVRHFGSVEYTFPLYENILRGIAFADYGNLSGRLQTFHGGEYRVGAGGGVLLSIPFLGQYLPISLTWANAISKEDSDRTQQFLFDIGFGF